MTPVTGGHPPAIHTQPLSAVGGQQGRWVQHPEAEILLTSVNLGKGSFLDLYAGSLDQIGDIQQALAA